jgi:hypothetical protein
VAAAKTGIRTNHRPRRIMSNFWYYVMQFAGFATGTALLATMGRRNAPWAARIAVAVLMSAAMAVFMMRVSEPPDLFADYFKAYYPAARAVLAEDSGSGLAQTMLAGAGGFVNLPLIAFLFAPFGWLPPDVSGYVFLACGLAATITVWRLLSRLAGLDQGQSLFFLFFMTCNGPLHNSLREGNTTHFILLLLVCGLWALRGGRDFLAGLVFGVAALIKLPLLLLGIYFLARGRWRVAFGGGAICALTGLASLLVFGWDLHVHWYEHSIKPFAGTPLSAFNSQSVQAFLARLQFGGRYLWDWTPRAVHPFVGLSSRAVVGLLMAACAVVLFLPRRWRGKGLVEAPPTRVIELETCILVILATVISTVSWTHYYLWLLLPAAYVIGGVPSIPTLGPLRVASWVALLGAIPVVVVIKPHAVWLRRAYSHLAVSHYLIAGLLLLAVLLLARWRVQPSAEVRE